MEQRWCFNYRIPSPLYTSHVLCIPLMSSAIRSLHRNQGCPIVTKIDDKIANSDVMIDLATDYEEFGDK